jgi:lipopolysaccharide exporter
VTNLNRQMAKGAAWLILFRLFDRGLGFLSTLILARMLVPADFGLIAMAIAVLAALELLGAFSFDLALIQNQQATRNHYDTAWTFAVLFGTFNALAMCALAAPTAGFYGEARVEGVMYALAACTFIQGFDNVGVVAFQKDLQLHKEFWFGLGKKLTGFAVTMMLAFTFQSYWALVGGTLASRVASLGLSYALHPYRPKFSLAAARDLFSFSKWLLLNNFLIFLNNRGTDFIIGRLQGAGALGLYSVSYEISNLPTTELVWPIQRAVFPGYAKVAGDLTKLRTMFVQVIGCLCLLTVPAGMALVVAADPIVRMLLGEKWLPAIPLIQVLAMFGIVRALHGPTGSVFLAVGKPFIVASTQCVQIVVAAGLMLFLVPVFGTIGAAYSILIGATLALCANYTLLVRELQISIGTVIAAVWRSIIGGAVMWIVAHYLVASDLLPSNAIARFIVISASSLVCYAVIAFGIWRAQGRPDSGESVIAGFAATRFGQISRRRASIS